MLERLLSRIVATVLGTILVVSMGILIGCSSNKSSQEPIMDNLLLEGLVVHYGFDNTASDLSGKNHDGVVMGDATYGTDRFGRPNRALYLDGQNDFVRAPTTNVLLGEEVPRQISVFLWFSVADKAGGQIVNAYASAGYDSTFPFNVQLSQDGTIVVEARYTTRSHVTSSFVLAEKSAYRTNEWHSLAVVFDQSRSTIEGFLDGKLVSSDAISPTADYTDNGPVLLGTAIFQGGYHDCFAGAIDDVLIYNKALSDSDVQMLHIAGID